jgi:hypothetical protein
VNVTSYIHSQIKSFLQGMKQTMNYTSGTCTTWSLAVGTTTSEYSSLLDHDIVYIVNYQKSQKLETARALHLQDTGAPAVLFNCADAVDGGSHALWMLGVCLAIETVSNSWRPDTSSAPIWGLQTPKYHLTITGIKQIR